MKRRWVSLGLALMVVAAVACAAAASETKELPKPAPVPKDLLDKATDAEGFTPLFKENLSNARMPRGGWAFEEGVLTSKGKGDIWTKARYGNFVLDLEFKCAPETNSGVFIRTGSLRNWLHTAIEVQVLQPNDTYENDKWHSGGIFDCLAPCKQTVKAPGEWNRFVIIAKDNWIYVIQNGELVTSMDLDLWTEAHKNPDGTKNKFETAYKDMPREGHFGFQYHGHPVWFRNLKVKTLDGAPAKGSASK